MAKELTSSDELQHMSNNARKPHFYEVFSSQSTSQHLKIPPKFSRLMDGIDFGSVSLTGPSGNTWYADLVRQSDGLFFHSGWPVFVGDHFLEDGDFLVFRYDGQLHFTVQVFDASACEKEASFYAECSQEFSFIVNHMEQKRKRDELPSNESLDGMSKRMRGSSSQFHIECSEKEKEPCISDFLEYQRKRTLSSVLSEALINTVTSEEVIKPKEIVYHQISPTFSCNSDACDNQLDPVVKDRVMKEAEVKLHGQGFMSAFSTFEEKKVAQSFTSSFPFFVKVMKRFNVSGSYTLKIPYQFSMVHLPDCKIEIILRSLKGQCWTVNSVPQRRVHTSHTICGGWLAFVRDNGIGIGDICVFELIGTYEFHVHIFVSGKEEPDGEGVTVAFNGISAEHSVTSHKLSEDFPNLNEENVSTDHLTSRNKGEKGNRNLCTNKNKHATVLKRFATAALCSLSKAGHENSGTGSRCSDKKNESYSQARSGLRALLTLDEQEAAQAFSSGFPNFVRIMKKFNVSGSYTLKIPYNFSVAHLPNRKTEIVLWGLRGKSWTVNSVPDSRGRMAHTFCGGWMAFVRDNDIKIGDACIFELVANYEMHVHISEIGRKSLENQSLKPSLNQLLGSSTTVHNSS